MGKPSVFDYLDYRSFLMDMFAYRKERQRFFSYRYFSQKAKFSSPNFLQLVMTSKRNLTSKSLSKVADGFELGKKEREFFEYLVFMNQADSHKDKDYYYRKMMSVKGGGKARELDGASYEYFSTWRHPVVREVAVWGDGKLSAEEIAAHLNPPITTSEAEKSLKLLSDLGLLTKDEEGRWKQSDRLLKTGANVKSMAIVNFIMEMLKLSGQSIERHPPGERDLSTVTVCVNPERMKDIKEKINALRQDILDMAAENDVGAVQVMHVNINAFPLTKVNGA